MPLLSRYAEANFWMARYMERAENLARLLDVNVAFALDERGHVDWSPIVLLNADHDRFEQRYGDPTPENVAHFYVLDPDNPTSVIFSVRAARENARSLRPLLSTELWSHLNVLYNWMLGLTPADVSPARLTRLCGRIRQDCQTHAGILEGTFYRDVAWTFYQIGKMLERADQTTRLVDIKYHTLLPSVGDVGTPIDEAQWNAVLRSAAGYHAFRRVFTRSLRYADVVQFLLLNRHFPRSLKLVVHQLNDLICALSSVHHLRAGGEAADCVDRLMAMLDETDADSIIGRGLHEFLDVQQIELGRVSAALARNFFGAGAEPANS